MLAGNGEPLSVVRLPSEAIENAAMVPGVPSLETYRCWPSGVTTIAVGRLPPVGYGEPLTGVSVPSALIESAYTKWLPPDDA